MLRITTLLFLSLYSTVQVWHNKPNGFGPNLHEPIHMFELLLYPRTALSGPHKFLLLVYYSYDLSSLISKHSFCITWITRFILSCGKDSTAKLWEVGTGRLVKQYLGATHTQLRCQVGKRLQFSFAKLCMWDVSVHPCIWLWKLNYFAILQGFTHHHHGDCSYL